MNLKLWIPVLVAIIGLVTAVVVKLIPEPGKNSPEGKATFDYRVEVLRADNSGVEQARVSLDVDGISPKATDSSGRVTFELTQSLVGRATTITVTAEGLGKEERSVIITDSKEWFSLYLESAQSGPDPIPQDTVQEPDSGPAGTVTGGEGATESVVTDAGKPANLPRAKQATLSESSGPKLSGLGKEYSEWYTVCSKERGEGWKIISAEFRLSKGNCGGSWAECKETEKSDSRVCWDFRFQGYNDGTGPVQVTDEGILRITWEMP